MNGISIELLEARLAYAVSILQNVELVEIDNTEQREYAKPRQDAPIVQIGEPNKLSFRTERQIEHTRAARRSASAFWRYGNDKYTTPETTGKEKFVSCAFLLRKERPLEIFDRPGMGLELQCLNTFMGVANRNRIIQNYVAGSAPTYKQPVSLPTILTLPGPQRLKRIAS